MCGVCVDELLALRTLFLKVIGRNIGVAEICKVLENITYKAICDNANRLKQLVIVLLGSDQWLGLDRALQ